jgi:FMN-dependent NADH-azoreductase
MRVIAGDDLAGAAGGDAQSAAWRAVLETVERVRTADTLLFTVPMWNSSIPWALKLFIDTVTQPGLAFRFDATDGYTGLLGGRRAIAIYTSHVYAPGVDARFGVDYHSTFFEHWLRFLGIDRIDAVRLQTTHPRRTDLEQARTAAIARARRLGASIAEVTA